MTVSSYREMINEDSDEFAKCALKWDCEKCDKSLCLRIVAVAELPTRCGLFSVVAFTNNKDKKDHIMLLKGNIIRREGVLTRLHSSCVTGDALGSLRCDCRPQLEKALAMIEKERLGILLYMQQEGRGIGLTNKVKAYMLQDQGDDTYQANIDLGFKADERQYEVAAAMLMRFNIRSIRLLTNNPDKVAGLERFGVKVKERVPLETRANKYNRQYLQTKKIRLGHLLSIRPDKDE